MNRGEHIVLKDGDQQVTLYPGSILDLDEDSPELEAELLKGIDGRPTPFSLENLRARTENIIERHS